MGAGLSSWNTSKRSRGVSSGFLWRKMAMTVGNSTIAMSPPE